jgi:hypothetical protein
LKSDYAARRVVEYELFYKDEQRVLIPSREPYHLEVLTFEAWSVGGAVAQSALSHARKAKPPDAPGEVKIVQENFAVVFTRDMTPVQAAAFHTSEAEAKAHLSQLLDSQPDLDGAIQVIPAFEVNEL